MTKYEHDFAGWYQEKCDETYWRRGQCCAGCDYWNSALGNSGGCMASGIVSGEDVMRSMGISHSTRPFAPGFPVTKATDWCGKFKDDFDWDSLDDLYLRRIGAVLKGCLQPKPLLPVK